ncbi:MAG: MarR family transcriptional regulator [Cyanobacteria bacterium P01_A01_bin.45]
MTPQFDRTQALESWQRIRAPYSISYRIKLLSQLLARRFTERLEPYGLTPFHWIVMCCLWEEDGLPTSSIGDKLKQVGATLTGVLDRMEERGLIRRERDGRDRRVWRIWLTESGKELETALPPIAVELREEAMQGISYSEREIFSQLLNRAIANIS